MRRAVLAGIFAVAGLVVLPAAPAAADTGDVFTFAVPGPAAAHPEGVTLGPDQNVWFTNVENNKVGRITVNGTVTLFPVAGLDHGRGIVTGPDGKLWFTSGGNDRIYRMSTNGGNIAHFTAPDVSEPGGITVGPDGALWFTNRGNGKIGRITTSGQITLFTAPGFFHIDASDVVAHIVTGPDGNLWWTALGSNTFGRLTPAGAFTQWGVPNHFGPVHPVVADDRIWFGSQISNNIAVIDPLAGSDSAISNSRVTYTDSDIQGPNGLTVGEDGDLWFTNDDNNTIGHLDPEAPDPGTTIESFPGGPNVVNPGWMTLGADGHVWFANNGVNRIGKVETVDCNVDPNPSSYTDLPDDPFYEEGLDWARCHAMVAGFAGNRFKPNDNVVRSQIINILWVMMESPEPFPAHGFRDVPATAFYNRAVRWGKAKQLINGFPGNPGRIYKPADNVNRCQLTNMMWNLVGAPTGAPPSGYTDVPNQFYCRPAVDWAKDQGLWDDVVTSSTTFGYLQPVTRSQVVDVLYELASSSDAWGGFTGDFPRTVRFPT